MGELERVAPKLKIVLNEGKEWRSHLEDTQDHLKKVSGMVPSTTNSLNRIKEEISKAIEKIQSREKVINQNFEHLVTDYQSSKEELKSRQEDYERDGAKVNELTNEHARIIEELEHVKEKMDSQGKNISDSSPIFNMKQALHKIRAEVKQMDLRIGAVEQSLMKSKLWNRGGASIERRNEVE